MFLRKDKSENNLDSELIHDRLGRVKPSIEEHEILRVTDVPLPMPEKLRNRNCLAETGNCEAVIGRDITIHGNVTARGKLRLEGTVFGDVNCKELIVETEGKVFGNIRAKKVDVHGKVQGMVVGEKVMLLATALVQGNIYHQDIGIEMGSQYDGDLQRIDDVEAASLMSDEVLIAAE